MTLRIFRILREREKDFASSNLFIIKYEKLQFVKYIFLDETPLIFNKFSRSRKIFIYIFLSKERETKNEYKINKILNFNILTISVIQRTISKVSIIPNLLASLVGGGILYLDFK